ncbi:MAG: hypothetical protein ACFFDB_00600 [Promethearchaeota archaeon]
MMKNKIFIGINRAEYPQYDNGKIIIVIAKDKPSAYELGNTSAKLPFKKIIQIGETKEEEQIILSYEKCRCNAESVEFGGLLTPFAQTLFGEINNEDTWNLWEKREENDS